MPYDGNGLFVPLPPPDYPAVTGTTIRAAQFNNNLADVQQGLSNAITRDGQGRPTADINWAGYNLSNVGNFSADAAAVNGYDVLRSIQDGPMILLGTVAGVDTITASATPAIPAYALGQVFHFLPSGYNTGAVTLNINSLGAKPVVLPEGGVLSYRNLSSSTYCTVRYDGTSFRLVNGFMRPLVFESADNSLVMAFGVASTATAAAFSLPAPGPARLLTAPTTLTLSSNADVLVNRVPSAINTAVTSTTIPANAVTHFIYFVVNTAGLAQGEAVRLLSSLTTGASARLTFTGYTW
jgi:hypothetical protein